MSLDRLMTELQETGSCSADGLTVAEVAEIVGGLGLRSREVWIEGGTLKARPNVLNLRQQTTTIRKER